jgi:hypothetical protein
MKFSIETEPFIRMVQEAHTSNRNGGTARLIACRGRVYVEGQSTVAETEAVIAEEGQCKVSFEKLLQLLKGRRDEPMLTLQADTTWLRCGTASLPISGFSAYAVAPTRFHVHLASETGVVSSKFLVNSLAQEV